VVSSCTTNADEVCQQYQLFRFYKAIDEVCQHKCAVLVQWSSLCNGLRPRPTPASSAPASSFSVASRPAALVSAPATFSRAEKKEAAAPGVSRRGRRRSLARRAPIRREEWRYPWQKSKQRRDRGERRYGTFFVTTKWATTGHVRMEKHARARPARPKSHANLSWIWVVTDLACRLFCIWVRVLGHVFTQKDTRGRFAYPRRRCPKTGIFLSFPFVLF
jgi:hypothetical protein